MSNALIQPTGFVRGARHRLSVTFRGVATSPLDNIDPVCGEVPRQWSTVAPQLGAGASFLTKSCWRQPEISVDSSGISAPIHFSPVSQTGGCPSIHTAGW